MSTAKADVCLLLARVAGGVRLAGRIGEVESVQAVGRCLQRIERAVFACGGRVAEAVGEDGTMAHFDGPGPALLAARQMMSAVAALPPAAGVQLDVRCAFVDPGADDRNAEADATYRATRVLSLFAQPGQILTSRTTVARLPPSLQSLAREVGIVPAAIGDSAGAMTVMAIDWRGLPDDVLPHSASPSLRPPRLWLRCGDRELLLEGQRRMAAIGRDGENDLVVASPLVSRRHARIERRGPRFILADQSGNGTFVSIEGHQPSFVRRGEVELHGRGLLSFGSCDNAEIRFKLID